MTMRSIIQFSGAALALLACTSEQAPTEPAGGADLARTTTGTYTAVDLGTLGRNSEAWAINPASEVVGSSRTLAVGFETHAFLWKKGVMTDLGTLGGNASYAYGINPAGQVV